MPTTEIIPPEPLTLRWQVVEKLSTVSWVVALTHEERQARAVADIMAAQTGLTFEVVEIPEASALDDFTDRYLRRHPQVTLELAGRDA